MRILYIHQYFRKPEQGGALRSYYLAKALVQAGHTVELITAYNGEIYYQEDVAGIHVHYLPVAYDNNFGFGRRVFAFTAFVYRSISLALKIKDIDLCYATSTPLTVGFTALALKKLKNIPFYFEVRDLWPAAPIQLGFIRQKQVQQTLHRLEIYIYAQAKKIITLSPGIEAGIKPFKLASLLEMIPNMADTHYYTTDCPARPSEQAPFYICYIGAMGVANKVDYLLDIAQACLNQNLKQVKFIIAGSGSEQERLQRRATAQNLVNITWVGKLNREQVRHYLAIAHATYTSFAPFPVLETTSPNKFFDSLASGKLTIVNVKGWLKELVEQHKCGFYADPENPSEFIQKLISFLQHPEVLAHAQRNARTLAEAQFSRKLLTNQFLKLFG